MRRHQLAALALFRDAHFSMPARWIAARKRGPTYLYRFDYVASFLQIRRTGASHGSEIPFVFATWPDFRLNAADQHMTRTLHGCWVAFAATGQPVCPQAPPWPPFSVDSDIPDAVRGAGRARAGRRSGHFEFSAAAATKIGSLDTFQLPGLVTDAMKAMHHFGAERELQLVFDLLRIDDAVTQ